MQKKYDHIAQEAQMQELWRVHNTYAAEHNPGKLYSIDTPPPTVSGALHIGHIFSYTQTDVLARYKRMSGFSVFYPFGFDDNGLPTERFVEKKNGTSAYSMGRSAFIELCLKETAVVEKQFEALWQKIGLSVDWSACYSTISAETRAISQASFIELYRKGYVYRKAEPALYCTTCFTSVAQAELDDSEKPSSFNDIDFTVSNSAEKLVIATTRPELLPACVALFYNPQDARYAYLQGKKARVPLFGHEVPILADEKVLPDKGTGLVMCCTFGDTTDIEWYKKYQLPYRQAIGRDGKFTSETGILAGLKVKAAREVVLQALAEQNLVHNQRAIIHNVNIHERCKNDIEYIVLQQWFVSLMDHKEAFLRMAEKVTWHPAFMQARYKNWVENINWDWCISRQRFFGIPFPVWHCQDCAQVILPKEELLPLDPQEIAYNGTCTKCGSANIEADTDVMDTWNTSSITPYLCKAIYDQKYPESTEVFIPMSMRPQAHDIIRTWAFDTIVKVWMHEQQIPWESIVISGHVLSTEKEKISKSQGNSPLQPENLLKSYPADVIRYWTATANLGFDTAFSETQFKIGQKLLVKLWNAFLFIGEHAVKADMPEVLGIENQWLLHRATETFERYQKAFDSCEMGSALDAIEKFFWHDLCDNYLELVKDQLFNPEKYAPELVASTRATLYCVGLRLLQWYAPCMPHVTEAIYQEIYKQSGAPVSLHQTRYVQAQKAYTNLASAQVMETILAIIAQVRKWKSDAQLSLKTEIKVLTITALPEKIVPLREHEVLLVGITHAQKIVFIAGTESEATIACEQV